MRFFNNMSIRRKQVLILLLTSSVALLLACALFVVYDTVTFRRALVGHLSSLAEVVGNNTTAAIDFDDPGSAEQTLVALRGEPTVLMAHVHTRNFAPGGEPFASYTREGARLPADAVFSHESGHTFTKSHLHVVRPITQRGDQIGTIEIVAGLDALAERRWRYAGIVVIVFCVSLLVALSLTARLERVVTGPVLELARVARRVATKKDYSLRVARQGGAELEELIDGFNEMLGEIQRREAALRVAHGTLERRVEERTQELAGSLSLLKATLESTADGILAKDNSGRITSMNGKFAAMWGFPPDMVERRDSGEMVAHVMAQVKDEALFRRRWEELRTNPEAEAGDIIELKDGRIFERYALPQMIGDRCVGVVINWRDITERRRAEEELNASKGLYQSLVDHMPAGVFRKDAEGRYVFVNSWFCRFKQVDEEHFLGRTPEELAAHELKQEMVAAEAAEVEQLAAQGLDHHQQIMRTGRPVELEECYTRPDGGRQHLHVIKSPVFDLNGRIIGSQGILFEITERKRVEAELAYERHLLRALLDSVPDSIYFKDRESRFIRCSAHMVEMFNRSRPASVLGKTDFDFFSEEHARHAYEDEQRIIRTGEPIIAKTERETWPDGRTTWVLSSKMPLRDMRGEIIGTFGVSKDITAIKEAEAKLEEVHKQLLEASRKAGMAEVATSVLHNVGNVLNSVNTSASVIAERVKHSKVAGVARLAGLLEEHRGDLAGFLKQEGRAEQVIGYLNTLVRHLGEEQGELVREVRELSGNIEHIKEIVVMQQSYAKVSGVTETVSAVELVEDSIRMNSGALNRHGVELVKEYEAVPAITVEKHKVLQVLVNLIRNAKYACDESGREDKRLTIRVKSSQGCVRIEVEDNGVGIPRENLTRIFSHGFTTRKNGHGFGLHSGSLAAQEMGGELRAHSEGPGRGATFILELPVEQFKARGAASPRLDWAIAGCEI